MNKEITIYELLELIKDDKAPRKIKMGIPTYEFVDKNNDYLQEGSKDYYLFSDYYNIGLICRLDDYVEILDEENEFEDIEEIKLVGCNVEMSILCKNTIVGTETPLATEHCILKINQLIRNQKLLIERLNKDE